MDAGLIEYAYDNLSRLLEARYNPGTNVNTADGDLLRRYQYAFDRAGNRRTETVSVGGVADPTITYDYNGANQLIDDGTYTYEYDGNGNLRYKKLTGTPVEEYTWNRANRLVTWDNGTAADLLNYSYDGLNNRISRSLGTTSPTVTKYLLDLQPGLSVVLAATVDTDVTRYVHGPMGIHVQQSPAGAWSWFTQDGLGSVRGVINNSLGVDEVRLNDPFGNRVTGAPYDYAATVYGFTGEVTETVNPLVHLRARGYNPALGVFTALDPFEGIADRPMSLNGYSWVEGNVPNVGDPSGYIAINTCGLHPKVAQALNNCSTTASYAPYPSESSQALAFQLLDLTNPREGDIINEQGAPALQYFIPPYFNDNPLSDILGWVISEISRLTGGDAGRHFGNFFAQGLVKQDPLITDVSRMLVDLPRFRAVSNGLLNELTRTICDVLSSPSSSQSLEQGCTYDEWDTYSRWIEYELPESGESTNWYFAMADFAFSYGLRVQRYTDSTGSTQVQVCPSLYVYDRYNWHWHSQAGFPNIPDAIMGFIDQSGMGEAFDIHGVFYEECFLVSCR